MDFYRRNLPHWQPKGAEYFITFRLAGSLPKKTIELLKEMQKQFRIESKKSSVSADQNSQVEATIFEKYEQELDRGSTGPTWLSVNEVAQIVIDSLHYYDQNRYDLYAYTIMSNHVHVVFKHLQNNYDVDLPVTNIMQSIKSFTGRKSNKLLNRKGKFWQSESYDRLIRNEKELEVKITYSLNNPVKANLVSRWQDWPYSYCKPEFTESM